MSEDDDMFQQLTNAPKGWKPSTRSLLESLADLDAFRELSKPAEISDSTRKVLDAGMRQLDAALCALLSDGVALDRIQRWSERDSLDAGLMVDFPHGAQDSTPYKACTISTTFEAKPEGGTFVTVKTTWHAPYEHLAKWRPAPR